MKIDVRGLLLGYLFSAIGAFVIVFIYSMFKSLVFGSFSGERGTFELFTLLPAVVASNVWAGFIIARMCRKEKIFNAMVLACVSLLYMVFFPAQMPLWYLITIAVIVLPLFYLGAVLHLLQFKKKQNEAHFNNS